jgi:malonate transporter and related proteins
MDRTTSTVSSDARTTSADQPGPDLPMSVLPIVLPIFALIAVGYLAARFGILSETAQKGISEFAFNFAMPALLFRSLAAAPALQPGSGNIAVVYFGGLGILWMSATLLTRIALQRPMTDAPTIAMTSCFGNIVMIGIPLVLAVVGPAGAAPMAVLLSIHTPLLWFTGILHQQTAERRGDRTPGRIALDLGRELLRNPLLIAIAAGALWRLSGFTLPGPLDSSLALLGQAGIPCAQVALGASLTRFAVKGQVPTLSLVVALKLLAFPAIVYVLGFWVFALPKTAAEVALIFAAMPAGANAFLFAERTGRVINSTSGAVALGTLLGAATSSLIIAALLRLEFFLTVARTPR